MFSKKKTPTVDPTVSFCNNSLFPHGGLALRVMPLGCYHCYLEFIYGHVNKSILIFFKEGAS